MSTATSPPGGNPQRKRRSVSFRKSRVTTVTQFCAGDIVQLIWDAVKGEPQLLIDSANGIHIENKRLTPGSEAA